MMNDVIEVDLSTYEGGIPEGYTLIEYEKGTDPLDGCVLYGFDEYGLNLMSYDNPVHAFVKVN
jgi:hypothetical protein